MAKQNNNQVSVLALVLSLIALALSGYAVSGTGSIGDDTAFQAKVEQGIEAYIAKQQAGAGAAAPAATGEPIEVSVDDDAIKGDKDAPVTIVEFSDYECPFCGRFFTNTLPQIESEYIDSGLVRLVYRDFPLSFHQTARPSAIAAECVGDQGGDSMYFAYHDKLFENQAQGLTTANLEKWAVEVGASLAEYKSCVETEKFGPEVDNDFTEGQSYGVTGTPGFFINGRKVSGAQPFSVFKQIIDEELAK